MDWPRDDEAGGHGSPPSDRESARWRERFRRTPDRTQESSAGSESSGPKTGLDSEVTATPAQDAVSSSEFARLREEADREIGRIRREAAQARTEISRVLDDAAVRAERTRVLLIDATERAEERRHKLEEAIDRARSVSAEAEARLERILDGLLIDLRAIGDRLEDPA